MRRMRSFKMRTMPALRSGLMSALSSSRLSDFLSMLSASAGLALRDWRSVACKSVSACCVAISCRRRASSSKSPGFCANPTVARARIANRDKQYRVMGWAFLFARCFQHYILAAFRRCRQQNSWRLTRDSTAAWGKDRRPGAVDGLSSTLQNAQPAKSLTKIVHQPSRTRLRDLKLCRQGESPRPSAENSHGPSRPWCQRPLLFWPKTSARKGCCRARKWLRSPRC